MKQCSMTGYGKGEATVGSKKITVEIRTLNGKQLDMSLKMPSIYRKDEFDLRSMATKGIVRGKCDIYVSYETVEETSTAAPINKELFLSFYNQIKELSADCDFDANSGDVISAILRMPEVVGSSKNDTKIAEVSEEETLALKSALSAAITALVEFREREGERLLEDILSHIENIGNYQKEVEAYAPERVEVVTKRIKDSIDALKVDADSNRLEQELIYYIEKYDINEEMVRLVGHLDHFRHTCQSEAMCGRKLGFISQEIGREINTTGSKANHTEIQKLVVKMKDELEKIKEQSLNLL